MVEGGNSLLLLAGACGAAPRTGHRPYVRGLSTRVLPAVAEWGRKKGGSSMTDKRGNRSMSMAAWTAFGLTLGVGVGIALGNLPIGIGFGLALGVGIGATSESKRAGRKPR
jgi:hypothetical protein